MALHFVHEWRDFREVGARPDDIQNFQALAHGAFVSGVCRQYSIIEKVIRRVGLTIRAKKALVQFVEVDINWEIWVK